MHFMSFINYRKWKTIFKLSLNSHVYWDTLYIYIIFFIFRNLIFFFVEGSMVLLVIITGTNIIRRHQILHWSWRTGMRQLIDPDVGVDGGWYLMIMKIRIQTTVIVYLCRYRVSHETWQLGNSFQCLLPWYCISYFRHFAVYFVKQIFYLNIYLLEINFPIILLPFSISYHHLCYQTT